MYAYLLGTLSSFGIGYLASHYNLMTKLYEGFNDIPSTTNKINLLYVLVGLSLLFLLILIPLNKIADYESKRGEESLNHPCANEFFSDIEVQRLQQSAIEIVNNESKLNLLNKVNIYDQDTQYIGESLDAFGEWVHVYNGETHIEGTVDMHLIGPFSKTPGVKFIYGESHSNADRDEKTS
ncbi:18299_t:CDS:2 [Entrophospora sp. SA101]|nr:18299_t:CDS:2 [Entrophospora sp. SA101]